VYTLAVGSKSNNAAARNGSGSVESCSTTTGWGTGCFLISDPFLHRSAIADRATQVGTLCGRRHSDSDFALGFMEVAGGLAIDLNDCADLEGCVIARVNGEVAATLNSVKLADPDGPSGVTVYRVHLPDCRYLPQICRQLLTAKAPKVAAPAAQFPDSPRRDQPLDPAGPNRHKPAAALNVTPILPDGSVAVRASSGAQRVAAALISRAGAAAGERLLVRRVLLQDRRGRRVP
jgi:hypothetical protein